MKYKRGLTTGTFDCLHAGHVWFLNRCAEFVEELVVLTGTDDWIKRYKGRYPADTFDRRSEEIRRACGKVRRVLPIEDDGEINLEFWAEHFKPDLLLFAQDQLHIPDKLQVACRFSLPVIIIPRSSIPISTTEIRAGMTV